jgi:hypothetical protein
MGGKYKRLVTNRSPFLFNLSTFLDFGHKSIWAKKKTELRSVLYIYVCKKI